MALCSLSAAALLTAITIGRAAMHPEYGYGGTCVPGYDDDCEHPQFTTTEEPPPDTSLFTTEEPFDTSLYPTGGPLPTEPTNVPQTVTTSLAPGQTTTGGGGGIYTPSTTHNCQLSIPEGCVFPFHYKGLKYTTCTGVDAVNTMWCSTSRYFTGHWRQCTNPCKNKWPVHAIVSGVVASGVAATGIGLIAAAVANKKKDGKLGNPFADLMKPSSASPFALNQPPVPQPTAAPTAPPVPPSTAAPVVLQTPSPHNSKPGVVVKSVPVVVSVPAPATPAPRRLGQPAADALPNLRSGARQLQAATPAPAPKPPGTEVIIQVPVLVSPAPTPSPVTTTLGNKEASGRLFWYLLILGVVVLCCACICGIAAAVAGGFGKKKGRGNVAPREEYYDDQPGYPQQYDQGYGGYDQQYDQVPDRY